MLCTQINGRKSALSPLTCLDQRGVQASRQGSSAACCPGQRNIKTYTVLYLSYTTHGLHSSAACCPGASTRYLHPGQCNIKTYTTPGSTAVLLAALELLCHIYAPNIPISRPTQSSTSPTPSMNATAVLLAALVHLRNIHALDKSISRSTPRMDSTAVLLPALECLCNIYFVPGAACAYVP